MRDRLWGEDKAPRALCAVGQGVESPGSGWTEHPFTTISHGQAVSGENMQQAAKTAELPRRAVRKDNG